jgi:hypothetical protein
LSPTVRLANGVFAAAGNPVDFFEAYDGEVE